ncbi:hypothetical protein E1281_15115 [Actinomadura sp. KC345]|uniref:hypothetical protein n=1 Tax=Actinomadura sp. KC345 TaxID=2530371 RepID=UPI0010472301|nr:hypothetical protein [Actinomadura sp. KC345]TDC54892.1 hypothetical protein E1281_15115 [Actinomadura sp. KC345]
MSYVRIVILTVLTAPGLSLLLLPVDHVELAGVLIGMASGFLLRGEPSRAAMGTLCGSVLAVLIGAASGGGSEFADRMAGWPGWPAGAVLAYLIAAKGLPPKTTMARGDAVLPAGVAALTAAALGCGQLVAAKAMGVTLWEDYHEWDGPGWYRDLSEAIWYPAVAVVIAAVAASRLRRGRGRFLALPVAAWFGCAVTAGPLQYAQALGVSDKPASVALLAGLAGGGIGAAAAAAGLRHAGTRLGLVTFIPAVTVGTAADAWLGDFAMPLDVVVPVALVAIVAARTARRDNSVESGVIAGTAGPLLIWSVYLTVGPRLYDHTSQSNPYWLAWTGVPLGLFIALAAATLAVVGDRDGSPVEPARPAK